MSSDKKCAVCHREAHFSCSRCMKVYYCSKDHQVEHWKSLHKKECQVEITRNEAELDALLRKRYFTRKQFYENYSNKILDLCLLDSKVLIDFEKKIKEITK